MNITGVGNIRENSFVSHCRQQSVMANCLLQIHGNEVYISRIYECALFTVYEIVTTNTVHVSSITVLTLSVNGGSRSAVYVLL